MRTVDAHRRTGVATVLLQHLLGEARRRGYHRLSLETGAAEAFAPARRLYAPASCIARPSAITATIPTACS